LKLARRSLIPAFIELYRKYENLSTFSALFVAYRYCQKYVSIETQLSGGCIETA